MKIQYSEACGPALVMGYDWERFGKHSDPQKNKQDQQWSFTGAQAVYNIHKQFQAPLTFFVLTKILDVPILRDLVVQVSKDPLVEIAIHGHAHVILKRLRTVDQEPVSTLEYLKDIKVSKNKIETSIGKSLKGFRAALGYYRGFQTEEDLVSKVNALGFQYISSDARNIDHEFPAPWYDTEGNFRQPYRYLPYGLIEMPIQGWSDNVLKGMSRHTPLPDAGLEKEKEHHRENLEFAIKNRLLFAPAYHPWSIGAKDPEALVIKWLLSESRARNVKIMSYSQAASLSFEGK